MTRFRLGESGTEPGFGSSQADCRHAYSLTVLRRGRSVQVDRFRESLLPVLGRQIWWGRCLEHAMGKTECIQDGAAGAGGLEVGFCFGRPGGSCLNRDLGDLGMGRIADWLRFRYGFGCGGWFRRQLVWAWRGCSGAGGCGGDGADEGVGGRGCGGRWRARGCFLTTKLSRHVLGALLHHTPKFMVQFLGQALYIRGRLFPVRQ